MIGEILMVVVLAGTAIILHEIAHGLTAYALGDPTAKREGRLTLNPLRHVDRFGTIILPGILALSQLLTMGHVLFMFGWAKPVPVDPRYFKKPRQMMGVVAMAGPAMNFALAFLTALFLRSSTLTDTQVDAAQAFMTINLVLGVFNLVPVPPLDGGRIMVGVLPEKLARVWARLERYGIALVMLLIMLPPLLRQEGIHFDPLGHTLLPAVEYLRRLMLSWAGANYVDI
jgi:Zn-dependent protease